MTEESGISPEFLAWFEDQEKAKAAPTPLKPPEGKPQASIPAASAKGSPGERVPTSPLSPQREATLPSTSPPEALVGVGDPTDLQVLIEEDQPLESGEGEPEGASASEVVQHAAVDSIFFSRHFFPTTIRQESPKMHTEVWGLLDDPTARYVNVQMRRDAGKTTLLRVYMAKRIAYGLSRTILYIGASENKTIDSIEWVKKAVERNKLYATTFGLKQDKPWTGEKARIAHTLEGHGAWLVGIGINGSVRGLNIEDHRPDLIVVDDVISDGNSATPDQRRKITELILGAVKESLAPRSEVPDAKLVIINTPQDFEDLSQKALTDPQFSSARFGCWTPETENLPIDYQISAWEERWSSEELRAEKRAAIARNMYSVFAREIECKLVTVETSYFREEWIKFFGEGEQEEEPPLEALWVVIVIDPVPPPSDLEISKGLKGKDFEAITAMGRYKGKFYVLETQTMRGHDPSWTMATTFELATRWGARKIIVEAVAYQKVLEWLLREAMKRAGRYWPIDPFKDKRKKTDRIHQGLKGPLSNGVVYFRRNQVTAISQVIHYPGKNPEGTHDDELETIAIGCQDLSRGNVVELEDDHYKYLGEDYADLEWKRRAP